jgi:uncharacterized membrane protein (GlpM family)
MNYTVVSKRKIAKLISEGIVKGMFKFSKYICFLYNEWFFIISLLLAVCICFAFMFLIFIFCTSQMTDINIA